MIDQLKNIVDARPMGAPLMGLDVGKKTIGVAVCDAGHSVAVPVCTIKRTKFSKDIKEITRLVREYEIAGYVIGYPLNMDGSEGPRCQSIRDFALEFERQLPGDLHGGAPWVDLHDERLSTATVEDFVDQHVDISKRKAKDKGILDKLAAQVILQGALDYISRF